MNPQISVAIIGCGWAGVRHTLAYRRCGARIAWAVDTNQRRASALAQSYPEMQVSIDYRDALSDPSVDAVGICLPHNLHAQASIEAARAGKHILCEKPIAATLEEADRMIEAADHAGVVLMVAENVRFNPFFQNMRDLLQEGVIGEPALIQMTREAYLAKSFLEDRPWFLDAEAAAGGIMMSGGIHDFETMRMLVGEIESIHALRARQRSLEMEGDDTSVATVRFQNGAVGVAIESFLMKSLETAAGPEVHTIRIDGDLGSMNSHDGKTMRLFSERQDYVVNGTLAQRDIYIPESDTFYLEIRHFLRCIKTGQEPITSGRSQRRPLEVVLAAYRSIETGLPVTLS
jgi:predicted dehydrogenase